MPVLKSVSLGYTSRAATFMDATTGAKDPRRRRIWERPTVAWHVGNVPCAGAWAPTCPCGWVVSLQSTWMPEPPRTFLYLAATSPQRGQPGTGPRPRSLTGRTRSGLSAPSAPRRSAHQAGRGSSSRARSTNRHSSETTTTVTGRYPSFIPAAVLTSGQFGEEAVKPVTPTHTRYVWGTVSLLLWMQLRVQESFPLFILSRLLIDVRSGKTGLIFPWCFHSSPILPNCCERGFQKYSIKVFKCCCLTLVGEFCMIQRRNPPQESQKQT